MRLAVSALTITITCTASFATRAAVWAEPSGGDLFSNDGLNPTLVTLDAGVNTIRGTTGFTNVVDRDYFYFTLGAGQQLDSIFLRPVTEVGSQVSFIGVQSGNQLTVNPTGGNPAGLLGYALYSLGQIDTNILDDIGNNMLHPGTTGFSGPLGPGTYAFWVQDTAFGTFNYNYEFNVSGDPIPTPLPGAYLAMLGGMGVLGLLRRRRDGSQPR
ncbi:MAG: hypothetical protein IT496_01090 [Gammaproteobacteria bacterium]|nr:hypothetical protein [Gammaproteobacteria bacterium]MCG3144063.1 hypothetical protein [Gammaproteobacteria bacterium]